MRLRQRGPLSMVKRFLLTSQARRRNDLALTCLAFGLAIESGWLIIVSPPTPLLPASSKLN